MKGPKNGIIRATFNSHLSYDPLGKIKGKCVLPISVGQSYHEGELFDATLELIEHSCYQCDIVVGDTLQRITMELFHPSLTKEEYYKMSLQAGQEWLHRNTPKILSKLTIPFRIIHWDKWLFEQNYTHLRERIDHAYETNHYFRKAVNGTIEEFIERFQARSTDLSTLLDQKQFFDCCLAYLKEECPILFPMWAKYGYQYIIYPKPATPALTATHTLFLEKNETHLCQWTSLKFKRYAIETSFEEILMQKKSYQGIQETINSN